jgi:hypothetical protein
VRGREGVGGRTRTEKEQACGSRGKVSAAGGGRKKCMSLFRVSVGRWLRWARLAGWALLGLAGWEVFFPFLKKEFFLPGY